MSMNTFDTRRKPMRKFVILAGIVILVVVGCLIMTLPCFAYSIAFLRNIWYNINNLKDSAAVTISTLATVWQQKIR